YCPDPVAEVQACREAIDLEFVVEDLPKLLLSMKVGADRIRQIVLSLRNFSRSDEAGMKLVDIHEGIDSTLLILQNRLKASADHPEIQVVKKYGNLPLVECYSGQLNQVFMNLLSNAIDAINDHNQTRSKEVEVIRQIVIETQVLGPNAITVRIQDTGSGIPNRVQQRIFDPFFTTKPVGQGTGLGLSISYQIITERHGGSLECFSELGQGAEFVLTLPIEHRSGTANHAIFSN
ncbi:HAMP domain-containing histidine kinase, partial [Leptolyngbya sp. FACHB-36]|uniref:sensor histidine kinase n=1 Tax=Leptolyngbya sp. FACHB-36 TaxID=2692808 RepID=UPI0016817E29